MLRVLPSRILPSRIFLLVLFFVWFLYEEVKLEESEKPAVGPMIELTVFTNELQ